MRGEQQRYLVPCPAVPGITPACAGSSTRERSAGPWEWDHPRMRGEQHTPPASMEVLSGSPPHARGAGFNSPWDIEREGITPACAGSSLSSCTSWIPLQDHPRMRGEQID